MKQLSLLLRHTALAAAVALAAGCATTGQPQVDFPQDSGLTQENLLGMQKDKDWEAEKARQRVLYDQAYNSQAKQRPGSIYQRAGFRSIYEDIRAKYVGDMVIIVLSENTVARQSKRTNVSRSDSASIDLPSIGGLNPLNKGFNSEKDFQGDGSTSASNLLSGTIATRVIEVLPSGHLRVAGEKQIGLNRQVESIRFYGIVDPYSIQTGNRVQSSNVADARIEYTGQGTVDTAQVMGLLSRVFFSVLPF